MEYENQIKYIVDEYQKKLTITNDGFGIVEVKEFKVN
jgi:hypothetical protein